MHYFKGEKAIIIDRKNEIAHYASYYNSDLLQMNFEAYYQNGVSYICYEWLEEASGIKGVWKKILSPDASFDNEFSSSYYDEIINARDVVYAGLSLAEDEKNNWYILSGSVYPVLRYPEKNGGYYNNPKIKHIDGSLGIVIDKKTLNILRIDDQYSVERDGNTYSYYNTYIYNSFDGDFKVTIPVEVLKAPESDGI